MRFCNNFILSHKLMAPRAKIPPPKKNCFNLATITRRYFQKSIRFPGSKPGKLTLSGLKTWKLDTFQVAKRGKGKLGKFGHDFENIFAKIRKSEFWNVNTFWVGIT